MIGTKRRAEAAARRKAGVGERTTGDTSHTVRSGVGRW